MVRATTGNHLKESVPQSIEGSHGGFSVQLALTTPQLAKSITMEPIKDSIMDMQNYSTRPRATHDQRQVPGKAKCGLCYTN